ncbi:MAG: response regulator transcription factor [Deltaproteobacteria bacterium]|nr:response regulator transcription factor [Deltaproteobacteria bacterium]
MSEGLILIVEDDESILSGLMLNLEMEGYQVEVARNGLEALEMFTQRAFDLVLLDLMLPGLNGFEVLEGIRRRRSDVPVLFLSARDAQQEKIAALDLGADDYVTKPFALPELLARIKAALRRRRGDFGDGRIRFAEVEIDPRARRVTRAGAEVELTAREFDLLLLLVRARERALTREQILQRVWGEGYDGTDRTIDNFIARLRTKLEADPDSPQHIETVRGVGYRFRG